MMHGVLQAWRFGRAGLLAGTVAGMLMTTSTALAGVTGEAEVVDGDTIKVDETTVRLRKIDTPESDQAYGNVATSALRRLIGGAIVRVAGDERGPYGRLLGVVYHDNVNINLEMVRRGHAWVYDRYTDDPRFIQAERAARDRGLGLWQQANPVPPWKWRN